MSNDHPEKIRYIYKMNPEARLQTAHGVWGGINHQGELELNFYHESNALPGTTECLVAPDGSVGPEMLSDADMEVQRITRQIHSRVLLNYDTARVLLEWLEERISYLEMEEGEGPGFFGGNRSSGLEQ